MVQGHCTQKRILNNEIHGKYRAHTSINGKSTHIGSYNTASEAHAAYCTAKEAEAYRWYERLRDGEFIVDPRVIERMRTWRVNE